jgi:hypothetical protein
MSTSPLRIGLRIACVLSAVLPLRAQLTTVEVNGIAEQPLAGSDPAGLLPGIHIGDTWHAVFTLPPDLALLDHGLNTAYYRSPTDSFNRIEIGEFAATVPRFAMRKMLGENIGLSDGTETRTDVIQLWGYTDDLTLTFSVRLYYPFGLINRFDTVVPTTPPGVVSMFISAQSLPTEPYRSAGLNSYSERGPLDPLPPVIRPVPEPSLFGLWGTVSLAGVIAWHQATKRRNFIATQAARRHLRLALDHWSHADERSSSRI